MIVDGLMAAVQEKGLAALGAELRAIEDADADAEKFPRFKKSDDATAVNRGLFSASTSAAPPGGARSTQVAAAAVLA